MTFPLRVYGLVCFISFFLAAGAFAEECSTEKKYDEAGDYIGCVLPNGNFFNPKQITELGCDSHCEAVREGPSSIKGQIIDRKERYENCSSQKLYKKGKYSGCKGIMGGHESTHNETELTELGCEKFCEKQRATPLRNSESFED